MDIVVVVVIVAGVVIYAGLLLSNPLGPPVAGPCRLVTRRFLRDYCSGVCAPGQACVAIATRPYLAPRHTGRRVRLWSGYGSGRRGRNGDHTLNLRSRFPRWLGSHRRRLQHRTHHRQLTHRNRHTPRLRMQCGAGERGVPANVDFLHRRGEQRPLFRLSGGERSWVLRPWSWLPPSGQLR